MTIDVTHKGTHILTESDLCDLIDERDKLAAALEKYGCHSLACTDQAPKTKRCICGFQRKERVIEGGYK